MKIKNLKIIALILAAIMMFVACDIPGSYTPSLGDNTLPVFTDGPASGTVPDDSSFEVHYIDVGQADAALVKCDNKYMLIDAGNREDSSLIYSYLNKQGITHLEYLLITHGHEDHVGGAAGALNKATVSTAFCSVTEYDSKTFDNFVSTLAKQGKNITVPKHGDTFMLGSAQCQVIGPISASDEPNNTSIVLKITYGNTSFLFTGDAEIVEENEILDAGYDIKCDVLKVGHHGSETSTGYRWLKAAAPTYAVISCGKDNSYGHPHEGPLSKLRDADVKVYRTDMQGTVICKSDGTNITFVTDKNSAADTLTGAGAGGNHTETSEPDSGTNATEGDQNPADKFTYILNTNSGKFHYPDCSSVEKMSEKNKQEITATREEMIQSGYSPCGSCDP